MRRKFLVMLGGATAWPIAVPLGAKQVELLRELLPAAKTLAVLADATFSGGIAALTDIEAEARRQDREIVLLKVGSERDLDAASAALDQRRADALLVLGAALFLSQRDRIVALAARHSIPGIYQDPEYVSAGGLMSYGASIREAYRRVGVYTGRILKGAKPAELPVEEASKVELVINMKTAKTLGLTIPLSILARADEVIE
jgi:putative ABC transport system substrate-binding protein